MLQHEDTISSGTVPDPDTRLLDQQLQAERTAHGQGHQQSLRQQPSVFQRATLPSQQDVPQTTDGDV